MTQDEIILETICFYAADPDNRRSIVEAAEFTPAKCFYRHPSAADKHCAVGRFLRHDILQYMCSDALVEVADLIEWLKVKFPSLTVRSLDDILRTECRGHPVSFWEGMQELHDDTYNVGYWAPDVGPRHRYQWCLRYMSPHAPEFQTLAQEGLITPP